MANDVFYVFYISHVYRHMYSHIYRYMQYIAIYIDTYDSALKSIMAKNLFTKNYKGWVKLTHPWT